MRHPLSFGLGLISLLGVALQAMGAEPPPTFKVGEFTFTRPAAWEWVPVTSPMRKAQLKVTDKKGSAEVVFSYFGESNAGGTKANVDRWLGQFQDSSNSKVEEKTVGTKKVTYVQVEGTYLSGIPGGPKTPQANSMLQGAIAESKEGNVFIKMTGPVATVRGAKDDFRKLVEGALR